MSLRKDFQIASRQPDSPYRQAILTIVQERPELATADFYLTRQGRNSQTFLVGDEVFKVVDDTYVGVEVEAAVQQFFHAQGCPVPAVRSVDPKGLFFSMAYVEGVPLQSVVHHMQHAPLMNVAEKIGAFKAQLFEHSLSAAFRRICVPADSLPEMPADESKRMASRLSTPDIRQLLQVAPAAAQVLQDSFKTMPLRPFRALHNDLTGNLGNILLDEKTQAVTAFLDFGSLKTSRRPEQEFLEIRARFDAFDPKFADTVMDSYVAHLPQDSLADSVGAILYSELSVHLGAAGGINPFQVVAAEKIINRAEKWLTARQRGLHA